MPAYLIVHYTMNDPELYKQYQKGAGPALKIGSETKVVVLDTNPQQVEGSMGVTNTVVLEFESMERAREIYESEAYQDVIGDRLNATTDHFAVLCEGFAPPA